jgi:hypothetical protein
MCIRLKTELRNKLENLSIILYDHVTQFDEIKVVSASLDNLLIKLIQNNCMSENQENELRLLINELNLSVFLENINRVKVTFTRERISQIGE